MVYPLDEETITCPTGDMWDGMAWSSSLDVARRFAGPGAPVYVSVATPGQVLARFDSRKEHEFVVNPTALDEIWRID